MTAHIDTEEKGKSQMKFLREDHEALIQRVELLKSRADEAASELGEAGSKAGDGWHDNFAFEDATRRHSAWNREYVKLLAIKKRAEIISPPSNANTVEIGTIVKFSDETGEVSEYRIGSFMVLDRADSMSYTAPLAAALLGKKAGETGNAHIAGVTRKLKVLEIRLPIGDTT